MKILTAEENNFYQQNGYILLKNIFSVNEVSDLVTEYDDLFLRKEKEHAQMKAIWGGSWQNDLSTSPNAHVKSIHNLQNHSAIFTKVLLHDRLLDAVEDATGCSNLVLHHTKAHLKPSAEGAPFPMHQDYHYFPYENHSMVAVFIHLDHTTPENGGLAVIPKSQQLGPLPDASDQPGIHYVDQNQFSLSQATPVEAKLGDVLIFSYLLVHGSYVNKSNRSRRMFLIQIASADDKPKSNIHLSPGAGTVLRGINTHANADINKRSEMNKDEKGNIKEAIF